MRKIVDAGARGSSRRAGKSTRYTHSAVVVSEDGVRTPITGTKIEVLVEGDAFEIDLTAETPYLRRVLRVGVAEPALLQIGPGDARQVLLRATKASGRK